MVPQWLWIEGYPRAPSPHWVEKSTRWPAWAGVPRWGQVNGQLVNRWPQHLEIEIPSAYLPVAILPSSNFFFSLDLHDPFKRQVCHVVQVFWLFWGSRQTCGTWISPATQAHGHHALCRSHTDLLGTTGPGSLHRPLASSPSSTSFLLLFPS